MPEALSTTADLLRCPACGYDLRGAAGDSAAVRCPECAARWDGDTLRTMGRMEWLRLPEYGRLLETGRRMLYAAGWAAAAMLIAVIADDALRAVAGIVAVLATAMIIMIPVRDLRDDRTFQRAALALVVGAVNAAYTIGALMVLMGAVLVIVGMATLVVAGEPGLLVAGLAILLGWGIMLPVSYAVERAIGRWCFRRALAARARVPAST